ncbi:hypothetical protein [Chryseobacterium oranimense]|uniref:hypothetical protein n=1 Tax=Chryseobacterium oranimense TaxID=421058 RepID=UPI0012DF35CB|nr:hypothetical protein [Chryseobacterium oranimense]
MKKILFTTLIAAGLILPSSFTATTTSITSKKELVSKKQKKKTKTKRSKSKASSSYSSRRSNYYSSDKGCTYNGNKLYVGKRGGCYYYSGSSKQYVDRSYCSGCN